MADISKYCVFFGILLALMLFTDLGICLAHNISATTVIVKQYQGAGCAQLEYINIEDKEKSCPGEGLYAIAQECMQYVECVSAPSNDTNTSTTLLGPHLLDYFRICDEKQYFNGTGCSTKSENEQIDPCIQLQCHVIEISMENGSDAETLVTEMSATVRTEIIEDGESHGITTISESNSNSTGTSSGTSLLSHSLVNFEWKVRLLCIAIAFMYVT